MPEIPRPANDAERLDALRSYDILDSPPDPRFDAFVRVAAQFYDVPVALVSLVDADRQWFKAATGLGMAETPRDQSFCAHAIMTPSEVMVVEDARADPRFQDNPLVTGPTDIRFYAGAPILDSAGQPMGTLCIIDTKPRVLDEPARRRLADLALGVGAVMDLHRASIRLHEAATRDSLTGLANPNSFLPAVDAAAETAGQAPCAVLYLDLDRFKGFNDQHGHAGGDAVLQEVGRRLQRTIRDTDLAARLHGDEFAVLLRGPRTRSAAHGLAQRILDALAEPMWLGTEQVAIRASVGVATAPADAMTGRDLLRAADAALYRAKAAGRGVVAGSQDMEDATAGETLAAA